MKNVFFLSLFCLLFSISNLSAQQAVLVNNPSTTVVDESSIKWDKMVHDFGKIPQNVPAEAQFEVTNSSDEPLIITNVKGSCGCTATRHDKEPIRPGESTIITATYNAKKEGTFNKTVTVQTNQHDNPITLKIKGLVAKQ